MFVIHKTDTGAAPPWEYYPAAAGEYQVGQLLNAASGVMTALSTKSTTTPSYICMTQKDAAEGDIIPVIRVQDDVIYETTLSAAAASATIGSLLEVTAGGLEVDAAAAGTFELVELEGTDAGDIVRGRFH